MIKHIVFWRMKKEANGNDMYENIRIAAETKRFHIIPLKKCINSSVATVTGGHSDE